MLYPLEQSEFPKYSEDLFTSLNEYHSRRGWLSFCARQFQKEGVPVVNTKFDRKIDIYIDDKSLLSFFVVEDCLKGLAAESTILNAQYRIIYQFISERGYIKEDKLADFLAPLITKGFAEDEELWVAFTAIAFNTNIDGREFSSEDFLKTIAYHISGGKATGDVLNTALDILKKGYEILVGMTKFNTAQVFGDDEQEKEYIQFYTFQAGFEKFGYFEIPS